MHYRHHGALRSIGAVGTPGVSEAAENGRHMHCKNLKVAYKEEACCDMPEKKAGSQVVPNSKKRDRHELMQWY